MRKWIGVVALAAACVTTSHAQFNRYLPANGKLGELVGQQLPLPLVEIDKKIVRLAPGARVYDQHNRLIVHASLPPQAHVLFVLDMNGDVAQAYILRPEEWERLKPLVPAQPDPPAPAPAPAPAGTDAH
jgi:hypothetical protein